MGLPILVYAILQELPLLLFIPTQEAFTCLPAHTDSLPVTDDLPVMPVPLGELLPGRKIYCELCLHLPTDMPGLLGD